MEVNMLFLVALFLVAILYSSVGHGGASGYLALMALFGVSTIFMRASALTLNLFVSAISFYAYYRGGYFRPKVLLPFILGSMPMAFFGARINIDPVLYKYILGIFLLIAVARMVYTPKPLKHPMFAFNIWISIGLGAFLGFFSGMIGIGGGIILSPILLLLGWTNVKETAAISALFIFLNSATGIVGMASIGFQLTPVIVSWVVVAFLGGIIGSWLGSFKVSQFRLGYILAFVLLLASFKLFLA